MTNEEAKQAAIRKAWSDLGINNLEHSDSKGFIDAFKLPNLFRQKVDINLIEVLGKFWRPISIIDLDDNRGWIRIETDGSNLPEKSRFKVCNIHKIIHNNSLLFAQSFVSDDVDLLFRKGYITHYKPIEEDKPPIY